MIDQIQVVCDEHGGNEPWIIATYELISLPSRNAHFWRDARRSQNQVRALIRQRDREGVLPDCVHPSQRQARAFLETMPDKYPGGGKPTTDYQVLGGYRVDEGVPLEAAGSGAPETRHRLTCDKCQVSKNRKAVNVNLKSESLGTLLDHVARAGLDRVTLKTLARMNGRATT